MVKSLYCLGGHAAVGTQLCIVKSLYVSYREEKWVLPFYAKIWVKQIISGGSEKIELEKWVMKIEFDLWNLNNGWY